MDNCKRCKQEDIFNSPLKEVNGVLGRYVDIDFLAHVKTSHGIEPEIFVGIMNSVVADFDPKVETNVYDTKNKTFIPAERRDWSKNL